MVAVNREKCLGKEKKYPTAQKWLAQPLTHMVFLVTQM